MNSVQTPAELRAWRAAHPAALGLVPTMGFLHEGHLSLVRRAKAENALVAASIFANPAQFNNPADLAAYPRDIPRDLALLAGAGCDLVFLPEPADMYPPGFDTWVIPGAIAAPLEGEHRPGHFRGVATVVLKLFNLFGAQRAYFGQKDAQQLAVIRSMARDLDLPTAVIGCPTLREADGLAMSSRNSRLSAVERSAAAVLYRALSAARRAWLAGEADAESLRATMRATLDESPLARTEYVSVAHPDSLLELERAMPGAVLSMAVNIGRTRLIDNIVLEAAGVIPSPEGIQSTAPGQPNPDNRPPS
ncbi:MAG: pantoate--beta-alanine ligase [Ardenticatenia bacterium]|nr:pantoate--beta-alanine ligase [Ardenticatenia bacterium]